MDSQCTRLAITHWRLDVSSDARSEWIAIRIARADGAPGLRWVWFVLWRDELDALLRGERTEFADGYHRLSIFGDHSTFYDLDIHTRDDAGDLRVPMLRLHIPRALWRYFGRIARFVWRQQRIARDSGADQYERVNKLELSIPLDTIARFERRYYCGAGDVDLQLSERCTSEIASRPALRAKLDHCISIARNSTRSVYQRARLIVRDDWAGYVWDARSPRGRTVLWGGLVNHATNPADDEWSIHT